MDWPVQTASRGLCLPNQPWVFQSTGSPLRVRAVLLGWAAVGGPLLWLAFSLPLGVGSDFKQQNLVLAG